MNENFTNTEKLIRLMDNELLDAERTVIQESLMTSPDMQQELQQLKNTRDAVKFYGLKSEVYAIHREMMREFSPVTGQKTPVVGLLKWTMRIAAGLFSVVLVSALYLYLTSSSDDLYQSKYSEYTLGTTRSDATVSPIVSAYQSKNYSKLIELSEFFNSENPETLFLTAMAYLQTNQPAFAIKPLESLLGRKEAAYKEDAEYYLALAYIKNNNPKPALQLFNAIRADKLHRHYSKLSVWDIRKLELIVWKK